MKNLERDLQDTFREAAENISPAFSFEDVWVKQNEDVHPSRKRIRVSKWVTGTAAGLAGVIAAAVLIMSTVPHLASGLTLGGSHHKVTVTSAQMDTANTAGINMFKAQHPQIELGFAYDPSTDRLSTRMVVFRKISKATAESLLNQLLTDISKSVPGHPLSLSQLLEMNYLHFEFAVANRTDGIDPLFYGDKRMNSTRIQLNSPPAHRPIWNVEEPVIPGTSTEVDGWVSKSTKAISIHVDGMSQTCSPNSDGYFYCGVTIPNSIRGTTTIQLFANDRVILTKTVQVTNAH